MDKFLLSFFGTIDRFTDWMFRSNKDNCSCGHTSHCNKKCTECRCEHCNCPVEKKKFKEQLKKLAKKDPFIYK